MLFCDFLILAIEKQYAVYLSIKKMDKPAEKNFQFYFVIQAHLLIKE